MATLLDGRTLAASVRRELKPKVAALGTTPRLGVVLVGNDPASHLYVNLKERAAAEVGIAVEKALFPSNTAAAAVVAKLVEFNTRHDVHAILVQLPLPPGLNEHEAIAAMDSKKDADGFHPQNLSRFLRGESAVTPGVAEGIVRLIDLAGQSTRGMTASLVVNSQEFAQPLAKLLHDRGIDVTTATKVNTAALRAADIIVVAIGRPGTIHSDYVKDGAIVIDVGTTQVGHQLLGDVAADEFNERPIYLTPVPGGVGPMTVAMLLWNVYRLAQAQRSTA